jgi:hypothetical protein
MDHIEASRGIRTCQPLPDSGKNRSASMPPDRSCGGAVKAADESFEGIMNKLVVADRGNQAQPVRTLGTSYGVESYENVIHLLAEELVLKHGWGARYWWCDQRTVVLFVHIFHFELDVT